MDEDAHEIAIVPFRYTQQAFLNGPRMSSRAEISQMASPIAENGSTSSGGSQVRTLCEPGQVRERDPPGFFLFPHVLPGAMVRTGGCHPAELPPPPNQPLLHLPYGRVAVCHDDRGNRARRSVGRVMPAAQRDSVVRLEFDVLAHLCLLPSPGANPRPR